MEKEFNVNCRKLMYEVLKEKYDSRIVDLCRVFISIYIVLPKEMANKIYNHESLDLSGCEYEGCFYHCFRCENLKGDYPCTTCKKWQEDGECMNCLFKYIQENKR